MERLIIQDIKKEQYENLASSHTSLPRHISDSRQS
jgi:hypothetical protein